MRTNHLMGYFLVLSVFAVQADETFKPLLIGGASVSKTNSYSYLGLITPVLGGDLNTGWYAVATTSYLRYEYDKDIANISTRVKVKAPGADVGIGYAWSGKNYSLRLATSLGARNFTTQPNNLPGENSGVKIYLTPQIEANYQFNQWLSSSLISNYSIGPDNYFNRFRLGANLGGGWNIGPEAFYLGGKNYKTQQYGLYVSKSMGSGLSLELSAGKVIPENGDNSTYGSVAFSKLF